MQTYKGWAVATLILSFIVILAGSIVRTTHSGMGCPDWPTCFGMWIPPTNASELPPDFEKYLSKQDIDHSFNAFHTWIEYINRLVGALLGLFALIQFVLFFKKRKSNTSQYRLALLYLVTVIVTGLVGAIVVKLNLQHASVSIHLLLAVVLLCIQTFLVTDLYKKSAAEIIPSNLKKIWLLFFLAVVLQSILGTMVRIFIDEVSAHYEYQNRENWFSYLPVSFLIHRTFSWCTLILSIVCVWKSFAFSSLKKNAIICLVLVLLNMAVGIGLYYLNFPPVLQPLHLLLATISISKIASVLYTIKN